MSRERGQESRHPMGMSEPEKALTPSAERDSAATAASDATLARAIVGGDLRAFEQLMRRHNRVLFRTARAILKDDSEAEDVLQEAYLLAHRSMASFRGDARLSTWLTRIV